MPNELDEDLDPIAGSRDVHVIDKRVGVTQSSYSKFVKVISWVGIILLGIPTIVYYKKLSNAKKNLLQVQQKLNANASQIDNYMEQRVIELRNAAKLLDKAIELDKETFTEIAKYRSGANNSDETRNEIENKIDGLSRNINVALENYPDLKAHQEIADCLQKNSYLQREITAARDLYNDTVYRWNSLIVEPPFYDTIAAKEGYTTRIPFVTTNEIKEQARSDLF